MYTNACVYIQYKYILDIIYTLINILLKCNIETDLEELYMHNIITRVDNYNFLKKKIDSRKTYVMRASHSKKFSSLIGPAMIPSGGFKVSSAS